MEKTAVVDMESTSIVPTHECVAVNATEMRAANANIRIWLKQKVDDLNAEIVELQAQLDSTIRHKWNPKPFRGILQRANQKYLYYSKLLAAVNAGFTIVPNMEVDIFAIRVKRENPEVRPVTDSALHYHPNPRIGDEQEQRLEVGDGRYESPLQTTSTKRWDEANAKGEMVHNATISAVDFAQIDFPLAIANSVVMDATARAMALKIFDRIGVVPQRVGGDPIVLGQITRKIGYGTKTASFLIAWYLDLKTL